MTDQSVPLYDKKPIAFSLEPYVLSKSQATYIESSLTKLLKQVEGFSQKALKNSSWLKDLGLSEKIDGAPSPLGLHIPFARFDFVFDKAKNQITCLELNTDGTSSWNLVEWLGREAGLSESEDPNFDLSGRLLSGLLEHKPKAREIVLLDFPGIVTSWEQEDLISRWRRKAMASLKSPKDKDWKKFSEALIYRRAVSWQLSHEKKSCAAFLNAWNGHSLTVVGPRSSDIGMSKAWPALMKSDLFPETRLLKGKISSDVIEHKEEWLLKPKFGHSGHGLVHGADVTAKKWASLLKNKDLVLQRWVDLPLDQGKRVELGLYFINGRPAGYLCRTGHAGLITDAAPDYMRPVRIV